MQQPHVQRGESSSHRKSDDPGEGDVSEETPIDRFPGFDTSDGHDGTDETMGCGDGKTELRGEKRCDGGTELDAEARCRVDFAHLGADGSDDLQYVLVGWEDRFC